VNHFERCRSAANFPENPEARSARERLLLDGGKVKQANRQRAGAVGYPHQQTAPPGKSDLGEFDLRLDDGPVTGSQRSDRHDTRSVFVSARQMKQKILHRNYTQCCKPVGESAADAAQDADCLPVKPWRIGSMRIVER